MQPLDPVLDEIEAARRKAHVFESRGEHDAAVAVLVEIAEKYPEHPLAREAQADALIAAGNLEEAKAILAEIVASHPGRIETERKHAKLVLKLEERNLSASLLLGEGDFSTLMNPAGAKRTAGTAALLSFLAPGFGQIYNGQLSRGLTLLAIAGVLWTLFFTLGSSESSGLTTFGWILGLIILTFYIGCLFDAATSAPRATSTERPERPTPPVDKPFE